MTTVNPTTYSQMLNQNASAFLQQHHFFTSGLLASHWFPLDSEAQFKAVHKYAMNGIQGLGPIDWSVASGVGAVGNLQTPNASRAQVLTAVLGVEYSGQPVRSNIVVDGIEFVVALLMQAVQTQLATGNYGSQAAEQFAQIQLWAQQAQGA
jgi:hypothetical protein